jgi:ferrochelatase
MTTDYDALLVLSFGGPEKPEDVMPFLENVTRGRGIGRDRLEAVAEHYRHFGGKSPINDQNRALIAALEAALAAHGPPMPVYWGNRNWDPFVSHALARMKADGVQRALAFVTSAYGSYSGCRQYLEDLERARAQVEGAPEVDKLRAFFDHPGFVEPMIERVSAALAEVPAARRAAARLVMTAHSVPISMARSGPYLGQLEETARLVAAGVDRETFDLVWQSRSGPPHVPWLEPDIGDHLRALADRGVRDVVVAPIGFISDHLEVVWDLDHEARAIAEERGLGFVRAGTVGTHPRFVEMIRELVLERTAGAPRLAASSLGPAPDRCAPDCCPPPRRPSAR